VSTAHQLIEEWHAQVAQATVISASAVQDKLFDLWGALVKRWAKNEAPRPKTVDDLVKQCKDAGVNVEIPKRYYANPVQFAQADENTILIRLPPEVLLKDSEQILKAEDMSYRLPPFYKRIFQNVNPVIPARNSSMSTWKCAPTSSR